MLAMEVFQAAGYLSKREESYIKRKKYKRESSMRIHWKVSLQCEARPLYRQGPIPTPPSSA